jgi:hypothetical protein
MNRTKGSASDLAIQSPTGNASSILPLRTRSANSKQLIEEMKISFRSVAWAIVSRALSEIRSGEAIHQIQV